MNLPSELLMITLAQDSAGTVPAATNTQVVGMPQGAAPASGTLQSNELGAAPKGGRLTQTRQALCQLTLNVRTR